MLACFCLYRTHRITITNFCLGKHLVSEDDLLKDQRGSPAYISPDVLSGEFKHMLYVCRYAAVQVCCQTVCPILAHGNLFKCRTRVGPDEPRSDFKSDINFQSHWDLCWLFWSSVLLDSSTMWNLCCLYLSIVVHLRRIGFADSELRWLSFNLRPHFY